MIAERFLFHGTTAKNAASIVKNGFRRARKQSYTGTCICLTEAFCVAYEFGAYEEGGRILKCRLKPEAQVFELDGEVVDGERFDYDRHCQENGNDAIKAYYGNVWAIWNPAAIEIVGVLSHAEALKTLCAEFDTDGSDVGYNGVADHLAEIWRGRRIPANDYDMRLQRNLQKHVGFKPA